MNATELKLFITDPQTSLEAIEEQGWRVEIEGLNAYFQHQASQEVVEIPRWVRDSISIACATTWRETQREIREAIGL